MSFFIAMTTTSCHNPHFRCNVWLCVCWWWWWWLFFGFSVWLSGRENGVTVGHHHAQVSVRNRWVLQDKERGSVCIHLDRSSDSLEITLAWLTSVLRPQEEEADEEDRLSEEAQRRFDNQHRDKEQNPTMEQPEGASSFVNMSFEVEQESSSWSSAFSLHYSLSISLSRCRTEWHHWLISLNNTIFNQGNSLNIHFYISV